MSKVSPVDEFAIPLGSGGYFDYTKPEHSDLSIEDIAYGLAYAARFNGQTWSTILGRRVFYSVAEHCVRMSLWIPAPYAYDALMHELGEGTCGDMTSPLKKLCPDFKRIEKHCQAAAEVRFGVTMSNPGLVKHYDLRMLATERRDLTRWGGETWGQLEGIEPFGDRIIPWQPNDAADRFLARYHQLRAAA